MLCLSGALTFALVFRCEIQYITYLFSRLGVCTLNLMGVDVACCGDVGVACTAGHCLDIHPGGYHQGYVGMSQAVGREIWQIVGLYELLCEVCYAVGVHYSAVFFGKELIGVYPPMAV